MWQISFLVGSLRMLARAPLVEAAPLRELQLGAEGYEALAYSPESDGPHPLLLYLHGAGEMSGTLHEILSEGATGTPPVEISKNRALPELANKFIVVAPHTTMGWDSDRLQKFLDLVLDRSKSGLTIDESRLYVTGHSMGGAGALTAAATKRFAAAVPVAASGNPPVEALKGVPSWAFHGQNDVIVPSMISERLISALRSMGMSANEAKLTLYPNAPAPPGWPDYYGHASTIPAYKTPELYSWLLQHKLPLNTRGHADAL